VAKCSSEMNKIHNNHDASNTSLIRKAESPETNTCTFNEYSKESITYKCINARKRQSTLV